jgi:hypothetical protein
MDSPGEEKRAEKSNPFECIWLMLWFPDSVRGRMEGLKGPGAVGNAV